MDQQKISKLLDVAAEQDQVKLKVLHNAVITCLKNYRAESTSTHLNDWQRAEKALEDFVDLLWSQHFRDDKSLAHTLAVADYLSVQGWKAGKSTIYKHQKEGKLRPQQDGTFRIADVEKYAAAFLKRLDGSQSGKLDQLQQDKLIAETRKSLAQAEHWEKKTQVFTGEFVPKDFFERELAKRASIFRSDLEGFARAEAFGIIHLVEGDAGKISDLISYLLEKIDAFLDRYTEEKEFTLPAPAAIIDETFMEEREEEDDEREYKRD